MLILAYQGGLSLFSASVSLSRKWVDEADVAKLVLADSYAGNTEPEEELSLPPQRGQVACSRSHSRGVRIQTQFCDLRLQEQVLFSSQRLHLPLPLGWVTSSFREATTEARGYPAINSRGSVIYHSPACSVSVQAVPQGSKVMSASSPPEAHSIFDHVWFLRKPRLGREPRLSGCRPHLSTHCPTH